MTPAQTAHRQHAEAPQVSEVRLKAFIETRLARREPPTQIATAVRGCFGIAFDPDHVVPYWRGEIALPTQTGHRQDDDKSVQFPADAVNESLFTRMPNGATPGATHDPMSEATANAPFSITPDPAQVPDGARGEAAPATQTGHRQNQESLQIPADPVDAPSVTREARDAMFDALGAHVKAKLGIAPDPAPVSNGAGAQDPQATQTGRRQNQKTTVLTDEMKAFIVRGLARYETPTRVAASVQAQFGVAIDRRQVHAYDPAGSRPPARRWIDLHEATRAKYLRATSEIGVAQKVVRLRMLDRFANRCDETNSMERAARFLDQAAKECGGFYERFQRPKVTAAPQ
jgi:hypothetical protein